jgi:hypothetical protein
MTAMPKKTKMPAPIRPELIEPLTEILRDRGLRVTDWPADEAAAYRDHGGFQKGRDAMQAVRMAKGAAAIEEVFAEAIRAAELRAFIDGVASAQAMTGFTDETFRAVLDKEGYDAIDLDGSPRAPQPAARRGRQRRRPPARPGHRAIRRAVRSRPCTHPS